MKQHPAAPSTIAVALKAIRRWLKDAWVSRVSLWGWLREPRGNLGLWEASGKNPRARQMALERLESRETPDDLFGLLGTPLLGTGLALLGGPLLTPAAVMAQGWAASATPAPSPRLSSTDGLHVPGLTGDSASAKAPSGDAASNGASDSGPAAPSAPSASSSQGTPLSDDPFGDPLGQDWLNAVGAALGHTTPPGGYAGRSAGLASAATADSYAPTAPATTAAAGGSAADASASGATFAPQSGASPTISTAANTASTSSGGQGDTSIGQGDGGVNQGTTTASTAAYMQAYGRSQLAFEANYGQTDSQVHFLSHGPGFETFLTDAGAVLSLPATPQGQDVSGRDVLNLSFVGMNASPQVYGSNQLPNSSNYFVGADPSKWLSDVPNYATVVYHNAYNGIDVQFHGDSQKELEYDFVGAPGADLSQVKVSWQGAQSLTTDAQGDLLIQTASGQTLTETAPVLYQTTGGVKQAVSGQTVINADGTVSFQASGYDPTKPLVVDPSIVYSSYLGGSGDDKAYAVAVDASGAAYVTGSTVSTDFPTASGYQGSLTGSLYSDVFVTKLNALGNGIVYSTYLGGQYNDVGYGIAVDLSGRAWVVGQTASTSGSSPAFPTTADAVQTTAAGTTAFALRLSAAGDELTYSTFLGYMGAATAVAVDALGAAYLTGTTALNFGSGFPTTAGAFQTSPGGSFNSDAFVAKLAPTLPGSTYSVTLAYGSYLGGSANDYGYGIAVDPQGEAFVTGYTSSSNFPTTSGAFKTTMPGGSQASFVAKVNASGSALSYSTYLAGGSYDAGYGIAVDRAGDAFVTGETGSAFPTTAGAFQTSSGLSLNGYAFVAKLKPDGSGLLYGSYLGGGGETGTGIAVDASGQATAVGWTSGTSFPVTANAIQSSSGGGNDAWAAQVNPSGSTLTYATYLGGSGTDEANGVAVDARGFAYLTGLTNSSNFPTSAGAYQTASHGTSNYDAFITKIAQVPAPPVFTGVSPDDGSSATDQVTDTGTLTLAGTSVGSATITLSQEGVGVIDTVTASSSGLWTSTYYNGGHTLPEGTAAFTATETVGGQTSDPSNDWLVTVDTTAPVVTLTAPATTASENPLLRVSVCDLNAPADGTAVTIKVYASNGTTLLNTNTSAATLTDGQASFRLAYTLTPGTTYVLKALINDLAGNTGTSAAQTVVVSSVSTWAAGSAQVLTSDPVDGSAQQQLGDVTDRAALNLDQSGGGQGGNAALIYNSDATHVRPILQATIASANNAALPGSVTATMTWNGTAVGGTYTYSTSGDSPGDVLTLAAQLPDASFVTSTGRYAWSLSVQIPGQSTQTFSGTAFAVTQDASPFGSGWTFGATDQLIDIAAGGGAPAGKLRLFGSGEYRFYQGTSTFSSPANDAGTLTSATGGGLTTYTYTTPAGQSETFNGSGYETQWTSADGQETLQFRYSGGTQLTGMTAIDGGLTTFSYSGGLLSTIQTVNSRTTTMAYSGVNLTQITNPDGGTHTFSYDTTTNLHHLTGETFGGLQNEWAYGASEALATITAGSATGGGQTNMDLTAVSAAATVGLTAAVGVTPLATITDPNGHKTQTQLDALGRPLAQYAADRGALTQWTRDGNGRVTVMTDPLGRATTYALDASGYVTQQTNADGTTLSYQYQTSFHALTTMTNERGYSTTYAYDGSGHLTSTTDAVGDVTGYGYNASGEQTSMTDARGFTTSYAYDADRRVTQVALDTDERTTYTYDANGNTLTTTDALNRVTTTHYDAMSRLTTTTDALGGVSSMTYNAAGLELSAIDANSVTTSPVYDVFNRGLTASTVQAASTPVVAASLSSFDAAGQATGSRDATAAWTNEAYDAAGQATQTTDALGNTTRSVYDTDGELIASRDALGNWTTYAYDTMGRQTSTTNAAGGVTATAYDAAGDVTLMTDAVGLTTTATYDKLNRMTSTTNGAGLTSSTTFNAVGNVSTTTDPIGTLTSIVYENCACECEVSSTVGVGSPTPLTTTVAHDAVDNVTSTTDPAGQVFTTQLDALNRATVTTDALSHATTMAFDKVGNATTVTDPLNLTTSMVYDQLNRQLQTTDPLSHTATQILDAVGQSVAPIDPLGNYAQSVHNALGEQVGTVDMNGGLTRTLYNAAGQTSAVIDAAGNKTQYVYDGLGRQIVTIDPLGNRTTTSYDAASRVSTVTDRDGREQLFHYDNANRVTATTWLSAGSATVNLLTYTYDSNGNQLTAADYSGTYTNAFDSQDRLTSQTDPFGQTLTYSYDAASNVTLRTDSLGGVLTSVYDTANRLTSEQFGGTGMTQARMDLGYTNSNQLSSLTRYTDVAGTTLVGTTVYAYDSASRLTSVVNKTGGAVTLSYYNYTLDNAGRVTQESWQSQTTTGSLLSGTHTYAYDATSQLTAADGTVYSYDANGNQTTAGYTTGSANRLTNDGTWTYTYDAEGDLTKKSKGTGLETWYYGYDTLNRLTSVEQTSNGTALLLTATYTYDVLGHRSEEDDWQTGGVTTVTRTVYDGDAAWADLTGSNVVQTRYLAGQGVNQWLARSDASGDEWLLTDRLGSVRDVVGSAGTLVMDHAEYQAFGGVASDTSAAAAGALGFDGERQDRNTGEVFSDTRVDNTLMRQWLQEDPIQFAGGDGNLRRVVGNDPTNAIDPTGLDQQPISVNPLGSSKDHPLYLAPGVNYTLVRGEWIVDPNGLEYQVIDPNTNPPLLSPPFIPPTKGIPPQVGDGGPPVPPPVRLLPPTPVCPPPPVPGGGGSGGVPTGPIGPPQDPQFPPPPKKTAHDLQMEKLKELYSRIHADRQMQDQIRQELTKTSSDAEKKALIIAFANLTLDITRISTEINDLFLRPLP